MAVGQPLTQRFADALFMIRVAIGVQQANGNGLDRLGIERRDDVVHTVEIERC